MEPLIKLPKGKITQKNQELSSFDILSVLASILVVVMISITVFNKSLHRNKVQIAKNNMENLALNLMDQPVINSLNNGSRFPASASSEMKDPWGNEYTYRVIKNTYGQPIYLVVVSGGPNSTVETEVVDEMSFDVSKIQNIRFENDDVGYIRSYR